MISEELAIINWFDCIVKQQNELPSSKELWIYYPKFSLNALDYEAFLKCYDTYKKDSEKYLCEVCKKPISDDEGITTLSGLWVCDDDSCRTLDDENNAIEKFKEA